MIGSFGEHSLPATRKLTDALVQKRNGGGSRIQMPQQPWDNHTNRI